jgi:hypothetical protein
LQSLVILVKTLISPLRGSCLLKNVSCKSTLNRVQA